MLPSLKIPAALKQGAMYRRPQFDVADCGFPLPLQKK
jgi:hypothetical protein